ncbi:hypothetical protein ACOKM5_43700 [Streptomyces sp. BH097]|uniref:hypothetical protein n=1 Tax=unclassified Streptomyces TaxID=2593676 RepID=UPI003BB5C2C0
MDTAPLTLDGYLCAVPTPGAGPGTAHFELVSSLTDDAEDDTVFSCTTRQARLTNQLLTEIQPGDLLHVTGTLTPGDSMTEPQLTVDDLDVLAPAPARALQEMVLDRYGDYVAVFDAGVDSVPVFTALGQWVGEAPNPDAIGELIEAFERRSSAGGT